MREFRKKEKRQGNRKRGKTEKEDEETTIKGNVNMEAKKDRLRKQEQKGKGE